MNTEPSPPQPYRATMQSRWRSDGPRFVLVAWLVSVVVTVVAAAGAALVVVLAAVLPVAFAGTKSSQEMQRVAEAAVDSTPTAWLSVIASQAALLGCAWLAWLLLGSPGRERLGLGHSRLRPLHTVVLLVATVAPFALGLLLAWLMVLATGTPDPSGSPLQRMWSEGSKFESMAWVMLIALAPGFTEELFYRGFLLRGLLLKWGPMASITTCGVLFAIVHGDLIWATAVLPLGLWLGVVAWRTGSVWLPAAMHASVNGLWTIAMMIAHREPGAAAWMNSAAIGAVIVGIIAFCSAVIILRRTVPATPCTAHPPRLSPPVALACTAMIALLAFLVPAGALPVTPIQPGGSHSTTIAQLDTRVSARVPIDFIGQDGVATFTLAPGDAARLMLPPNESGVEHIVVSLDANGTLVWLAYSGELSSKRCAQRPTGVLEQLASGAPTWLCLSIDEHTDSTGVLVHATLEEDASRISAAMQHAVAAGWATRGRR